MKKLSTYLFLILFSFQTPSWADDISDFQIEGMSIGDSLLDYFSETEIKNFKQYNNKNSEYTSDRMYEVEIDKKETSTINIYSAMQISLKTNDKKYKIYAIRGIIDYTNNIKDCYSKQKQIVNEIKELNFDATKEQYTKNHVADKSGKSKNTTTEYKFNSGDLIRISCYDWSKAMGYYDNLRVGVHSSEYLNWIRNEAYE